MGFILCLALICSSLPVGAEELFPVYPSIQPNVRFWEDIYSRYSTRQGVLHDQRHLDIVYGVVDLVDWNTPGSAHINKQLIKLARHRYKSILADLAAGKKPHSEDERHIAEMFRRNKGYSYSTARDNIRLQIGQKDRFLKGVIRAGAYMPIIKKILRAENLPLEIAYLPHVESSFNSDARSKAGAVGLWQFTRSTGRRYMTINDVVDERYDPFLSTRAAAMFLRENYEALGSWPLAVTAYNHGRAGMIRAVQDKGSYVNIFSSHHTSLFQFASRNFYPEFLAALHVARQLEGTPSLAIDRPEATLTLRLKGYAGAEDLMTYFRVAREDFTRLNPALGKKVMAGRKFIPKGFPVRLPATSRIRSLVDKIPGEIYYAHQVRDKEYIVRRGDTAGSIARKYKLTVAELVQANNLDRRATIRIGQKLKVPSGQKVAVSLRISELRDQSKTRPD